MENLMQIIRATIRHLHDQPGQRGTRNVRPQLTQRLASGYVAACVACISMKNEIFKTNESDLGMT